MASLERQILDVVEGKLEAVRVALGWSTLLVDPPETVGDDEMNALVLAAGGIMEPGSLTGGVETNVMEFSVGLVVVQTEADNARDLLDAGFVAIVDALIDPADIQLGGLAVDVRRGAASPPYIGRGRDGARIVGVREVGFLVSYWAREGDASNPGP